MPKRNPIQNQNENTNLEADLVHAIENQDLIPEEGPDLSKNTDPDQDLLAQQKNLNVRLLMEMATIGPAVPMIVWS